MTSVEVALARLRAAGSQIERLRSPIPLKSPTFGPGCCPAEIAELLADNCAILSEYAEYLSLCRRIDADDVFCGYFLHSPLRVVRREAGQPRFLLIEEGPGQQLEVSVLTVGSDGGGNLFLLGTTPPMAGAVWKWSHEAPVRFDGMAKEGLTLLGDSFAGFLARMATDWEHFAVDDRDWHYVAG